jgi:hypothetical protein
VRGKRTGRESMLLLCYLEFPDQDYPLPNSFNIERCWCVFLKLWFVVTVVHGIQVLDTLVRSPLLLTHLYLGFCQRGLRCIHWSVTFHDFRLNGAYRFL